MPPPLPSAASARPPRRTLRLPVWMLHLLTLATLAMTGLQVGWSAHARHGWDPWAAGLLGAGTALLVGIALGIITLLVRQHLVLEYQKGIFEVTLKEVEVLSRLLGGGRFDDAKSWAKAHRQDAPPRRRRWDGDVPP